MSRTIIGAVVAAAIALLTGVAYFAATKSLESKISTDVKVRVAKAQELLVQNAKLEMLSLMQRSQVLAREPGFVSAMGGKKTDAAAVDKVLQKFRASLSTDEDQPDILAVTDASGRLVSLVTGTEVIFDPIPDTYLKNGKPKYAAINLALTNRQTTSSIFDYESKGPIKAAITPIIHNDEGKVLGALLVGYAITSLEASDSQKLLGVEVVFFNEGKVYASSFGKDAAAAAPLAKPLFEEGLAKQALSGANGLAELTTVSINNANYVATAGRLPRYSSQPFPGSYPAPQAGAMVLVNKDSALASIGAVKAAILLLGLGSLLAALFAMSVATKKILGPLDEIEVGVNDIINGNLDRTFRPVGSDLDGLSNALNVMLARLLGRPEPGEETFDDDGNIVTGGTGGMLIADRDMSPKEAEALALAREAKDDYLKRVFDEYCEARLATGEGTEGISFEGFTTKLQANENKLRQRYKCREVRFKVTVDGQSVTLKPVPIV